MDTKTGGARPIGADEMRFMSAAQSGDTSQFALATERFRRELQVHCYRMLASYEDAQDMTQETFLRAWNHRQTFEGRSSLRTWLYRIATHCCLDFLDKRKNRTPIPAEIYEGTTEVRYLQPYPDRLLPDDPQESAVARETIELAFIVAVQHLPPRQRAVLILRDVLGWQASHTANALDLTVASVNSALQRARATMREQLPDARLDWRAPTTHELSADERNLVSAYIDAHEQLNITKLTTLLRDDLRFAMPPQPGVWVGRDAAVDLWVEGGFGKPGFDEWRGIATTANRQPAVAMYVRQPGGSEYSALAIDVLRVVDGLVTEIYTYDDTYFESFGLPPVLEEQR
ncbi:RNA polymerase subunit sigma-70 [Hoyosella rhizosphaerae]|uniref:RNA polymerase sigma factor n=1 Tax=Hoyosella rhizosphaerae TaxID=1755582 RepID=A0A916X861_9ACTN|nr:RNA polymerase subunit sigma-70 [Hoyosella rhizosphaerae]MBN4927179.1 RNA polymerase subunit sigma-70 [Hoyosella rhizosphaerae]GGC53384.1 RNA polymerase sigma factor [Hoyosella rhizosphaerae]